MNFIIYSLFLVSCQTSDYSSRVISDDAQTQVTVPISKYVKIMKKINDLKNQIFFLNTRIDELNNSRDQLHSSILESEIWIEYQKEICSSVAIYNEKVNHTLKSIVKNRRSLLA